MEYTKEKLEEIKTLSDAWAVFKRHGLEAKYCPHCDQFSQARVLLKQDEIISAMCEALEAILLNREVGEYESQKQGLPRMIEVNDMGRQALSLADRKV